MSLKPAAARWFEVITTRKDLARTVACLARTGAVELEAGAHEAKTHVLPDLDPRLKIWGDLARRYRGHWPPPRPPSRLEEEPAQALEKAMRSVAAWRVGADPLLDGMERLDAEARELALLSLVLELPDARLPPLDLLARAQGRVAATLIAYPPNGLPRELPPVLMQRFETGGYTFLLAVGRTHDVREIESLAPGLKGVHVPLPDWLPARRGDATPRIASRRQEIANERQSLEAALSTLSERHGIGEALGIIQLVEWLAAHARELRASERLVWVTGWTSDFSGSDLRAALQGDNVHALARLSAPPAGRVPPILMRNPRWARAFESFVRLLGTPSTGEADPTALLALIAPVLFGFMFADVGQGLVVALAGLLLRRRAPFLAILVPGGVLAALFGVLFGSVFCREDIIAPLWLHPQSEPLTMLLVAIVIGASILALGLLLDAVQAHWRGAGAEWWRTRAGLAVAYGGLIASPLSAQTLWLIALGGLWFAAGSALPARAHRLAAASAAIAEFIEQAAQMAINTLSFARVGAFALAHAGLSAAVIGIAEAAGGIGYGVVLVLGNALIIMLEGLVVGIQMTRLILFEFFIRFLKGGGREFKPLALPSQSTPRTSATLHQSGTPS